MNELSKRVKRLQVKAHLRGSKENCELLGYFAKKYLLNTDTETINSFEQLLEFSDPEITDWLLGYMVPPEHLAEIIESITQLYKKV